MNIGVFNRVWNWDDGAIGQISREFKGEKARNVDEQAVDQEIIKNDMF
jgi:hypothetical protein